MTSLAFALERAPRLPSRLSAEALLAARQRSDPLADEVVAVLAEARVPPAAAAAFVEERAKAGDLACRRLREHMGALPSWVDFERMAPGSAFSLRNVVPAGFALLVGSLVESYASAESSRVLVGSGRLVGDTHRRMMETVQFVTDLALDRGPRPGTRSATQVLTVRLMHAWARRGAIHSGWNQAVDGVPVSQRDLAWVLTLFSHVFRRSVEALGVPLAPEHHDAVHHCWRTTGYLLGIDEALLPTSAQEEQELYLALSEQNARSEHLDDGRRLTAALFDANAGSAPFYVSRDWLEALSRRCIGQRLAVRLGLPESSSTDGALERVVRFEARRNAMMESARWIQPMRVRFGQALVEVIRRAGGGHQVGGAAR